MGLSVNFCECFLPNARQKIPLFMGVHANKAIGTWIPANKKPFGIVVKQHESHAEICFQKTTTNESNRIFDQIAEHRTEIEIKYGGKLRWERLPEKKRSKIMTYPVELGYNDIEKWPTLIEQLVDDSSNFFNAIADYIPRE